MELGISEASELVDSHFVGVGGVGVVLGDDLQIFNVDESAEGIFLSSPSVSKFVLPEEELVLLLLLSCQVEGSGSEESHESD